MEELLTHFDEAKKELELALQDFNFAEPEYIDVAIANLNTKQAKCLDLLREMVKEG